MPLHVHRNLAIPLLGTLLCLATTASAQTPPIKPGLWEMQGDNAIGDEPIASPSAHLQNLTPEVRAKVQAMMKAKGIAIGSDGNSRICLTRESMDPARWQNLAAGCRTEYLARTDVSWKWHTSCSNPPAETDGQAIFGSPESYTVKTAITMSLRGEKRTQNMTVRAKWLGAQCGDLRPFSAPKP